jgi:hypothetical protein
MNLRIIGFLIFFSMTENKKNKIPWPTKDAMKQIYSLNLWGGSTSKFFSGEGSHNPKLINPYLEEVIRFLTSFEAPLSICDLGCGDFNIGRNLVPFSKHYFAIDIVDELIAFNQTIYTHEKLEFLSKDIATEELPPADCVILRQVLQHLSNKEVNSIVQKLSAYRYILLTEHLPEGNFTPNLDIISGQGIRLKQQSGIDISAPPFNFKAIEEREILSISLENNKGRIVTTLFRTLQ